MRESSGVKPKGVMKVTGESFGASSTDLDIFERFEYERRGWDPKDGELCLNRVKPEETLVEARRDSNVQIDLKIWV